MSTKKPEYDKPIHSRQLTLSTHHVDEKSIIVKGRLVDDRFVCVFDAAGEFKKPGVVHHIEVDLHVTANPLILTGVNARMIQVPMDECRSTLDNLPKLVGLEVKSGFSRSVKSLVGGKDGCNHLAQLIVALGQEIVSGWLTQKRQEKHPLPENVDNFQDKDYIFDSCRMWSKHGARYQHFLKVIENQSKNNYNQ